MGAVEELIKEMQQLKDTKLYQGSFKAIDDCIHLAYAKLELEKEQMIEFASYYTPFTKEELEIGFNHKFKQPEQ
jgi:trans-2-enoyl-CoA reductase